MKIPAFAAIVAQPKVSFPGAGTVINYVLSVGTDGIIGVKSGFTQASQGCVVLVAPRDVAGRQELVYAAVTGQGGAAPLSSAEQAARTLLDTSAAEIESIPVVRSGRRAGSVRVRWRPAHPVPIATSGELSMLAWPGATIDLAYTPVSLNRVRPGDVVGHVQGTLGPEVESVPLVAEGVLPGPSLTWHALHG
jgi:D-alanyl-D-alanine carboxypeptidase (penicillin-binding protein 5/6)